MPLNLAFPERNRRIITDALANFVQGAFLAAGTRIEHEGLHLVSRAISSFSPPAYRRRARECIACAPLICLAGTAESGHPCPAISLPGPRHHRRGDSDP